jgi:hypothetical protein
MGMIVFRYPLQRQDNDRSHTAVTCLSVVKVKTADRRTAITYRSVIPAQAREQRPDMQREDSYQDPPTDLEMDGGAPGATFVDKLECAYGPI